MRRRQRRHGSAENGGGRRPRRWRPGGGREGYRYRTYRQRGQPACTLKPAMRLVDNTMAGNIQGTVSNTLVPSGCTPGVYLYSGTVTAPEDMNSTAPTTDTNQPLASKVPVANSQPPYYYQFTLL